MPSSGARLIAPAVARIAPSLLPTCLWPRVSQAQDNEKLAAVQLPALTTVGGELTVRSLSPALARAQLIAPQPRASRRASPADETARGHACVRLSETQS